MAEGAFSDQTCFLSMIYNDLQGALKCGSSAIIGSALESIYTSYNPYATLNRVELLFPHPPPSLVHRPTRSTVLHERLPRGYSIIQYSTSQRPGCSPLTIIYHAYPPELLSLFSSVSLCLLAFVHKTVRPRRAKHPFSVCTYISIMVQMTRQCVGWEADLIYFLCFTRWPQ